MTGRVLAATLLASLALVALAGCGGTGEAKPDGPVGWSQPNANNASTRAVPGPAAPATVDRLRVRWRFRLRGEPGFSGIDAATPVVLDRRVYLQDLNSDVYALSLADGRLFWRHRYGRPDGGPNGVAVANGVVYGNTDTSAFALSARTGAEWWRKAHAAGEPHHDRAARRQRSSHELDAGSRRPGHAQLDARTERCGGGSTHCRPVALPPEASGAGAAHPAVNALGRVSWGTANPHPSGGRVPIRTADVPRPVRRPDSLLVRRQTGALLSSDQGVRTMSATTTSAPPLLVRPRWSSAQAKPAAHAVNRYTGRVSGDGGRRPSKRPRPLPTRPATVCPGGGRRPDADGVGDRQVFVPVVDLCLGKATAAAASGLRTDYSKGTGELVALILRADADSGHGAFAHPPLVARPSQGYGLHLDPRPSSFGLWTRDGSIVAPARAGRDQRMSAVAGGPSSSVREPTIPRSRPGLRAGRLWDPRDID